MNTLKNKMYIKYDYLSRYTQVPCYFDTLSNREVYGIGLPISRDIEYLSHEVKATDTLDYLALKYYNNPTYWWVIAYFNDIQDAFASITDMKTIKIPNISAIEFEESR